MKQLSYYPIGTLVAVQVPDTPQTQMLLKYNGTVHKITRHQTISHQTIHGYTLEGCESKYRIPYWFADDWLREVWTDEK